MEENNKRKTLVLTVIGVAILLVLVIGSTFAYFSITSNSGGSSQAGLTGDIESLDKYGEAFLTGGKNLHINLAASDMSYSKKGTSYYATDVESDSYRLDKGNHKISKVEIARGEVNDVAYSCTSDLTIIATGTIVDKVKTDGSIMTDADGSIYFGSTSETAGNKATLSNQKISLKKLIQEQGSEGYKTKVNYTINGSSNVELTTDIEMVNTEKEQNEISGGNINITIKNENLLCTIQNKKAYMKSLVSLPQNEEEMPNFVIGMDNHLKVEKVEFVDYIPDNLDSEEIVAYYDLTDTSKGTEANSVIGWLVKNGNKGTVNSTEVDLYNLYIGSKSKIYGADMSYAFALMTNLKTITFDNLDTSEVTNMSSMFINCSSLTSLDLSKLDTSQVTDMSGMFSGCSSLTTLDLSNFDTSKVTNMGSMFYNCSNLTSLDLSNFNTSNVTNMSDMFSDCRNLTTLNLSNFDTSNVTNMESMFASCSSLSSLGLSNFDTSQVTTMAMMFFECSSLTSLNLSNFDTSQVTNMNRMFFDCSSLTSLNLSNFNTSKVTSMESMFFHCSNLTTLDLSNFDTSQVTDMSSMFNNCSSLTTLDLSNFNTSNVTDMYNMFDYCSKLTSLDMRTADFGKVTSYSYMFKTVPTTATMHVKTGQESFVTTAGFAGTIESH